MTTKQGLAMRVGRTVGFAVLVTMGLSGALTGCGEDGPPPPGTFAPLQYDYLTKLRLNVGSIDIQNHAAPLGPDDISVRSPVTPAQALEQIGHDRLFAAGLQGSAEFVIDQASIVRGAGGGLYGQMAVHLEVLMAGGQRAAYAEARVSQQHFPGSDDENQQTVLYDMTRKMADSMNVELEYQMKRSLGDFLVTAGVIPSAVSATPLGSDTAPPPGAAPLASPSPQPVPAPYPVPPSSDAPPGGEPPPQMSPPPGYLQLPPGQGQ